MKAKSNILYCLWSHIICWSDEPATGTTVPAKNP